MAMTNRIETGHSPVSFLVQEIFEKAKRVYIKGLPAYSKKHTGISHVVYDFYPYL
jgi:hypothetical protein